MSINYAIGKCFSCGKVTGEKLSEPLKLKYCFEHTSSRYKGRDKEVNIELEVEVITPQMLIKSVKGLI